jgi:hypothetical protein
MNGFGASPFAGFERLSVLGELACLTPVSQGGFTTNSVLKGVSTKHKRKSTGIHLLDACLAGLLPALFRLAYAWRRHACLLLVARVGNRLVVKSPFAHCMNQRRGQASASTCSVSGNEKMCVKRARQKRKRHEPGALRDDVLIISCRENGIEEPACGGSRANIDHRKPHAC